MEDFFFKVLELLVSVAFLAGSPYISAKSNEGKISLRGMRICFLYDLLCGIAFLTIGLTIDIAPWFKVFEIGCALISFFGAAKRFYRVSGNLIGAIEGMTKPFAEDTTVNSANERPKSDTDR